MDEIAQLHISIPSIRKNLKILRKIGFGTFSNVFLAKARGSFSYFALKHINETNHPERTHNEIACLKKLKGASSIIPLDCVYRENGNVILVMPYIHHESFADYFFALSLIEVKRYIAALLAALAYVHAAGFVHRDVKPTNFLFDRKNNRFALIDFGLAQTISTLDAKGPSQKRRRLALIPDDEPTSPVFTIDQLSRDAAPDAAPVSSEAESSRDAQPPSLGRRRLNFAETSTEQPNKQRRSGATECECFRLPRTCDLCQAYPTEAAPRDGTPGYRPLEVLLRCRRQTPAVDTWAVGVILLSLLSSRYPFFAPKDDMDALGQLVAVFGTDAVRKAGKSVGKAFTSSPRRRGHSDLGALCRALRQAALGAEQHGVDDAAVGQETFDDEAVYDLLTGLLALDPSQRLSVEVALKHPAFDEL